MSTSARLEEEGLQLQMLAPEIISKLGKRLTCPFRNLLIILGPRPQHGPTKLQAELENDCKIQRCSCRSRASHVHIPALVLFPRHWPSWKGRMVMQTQGSTYSLGKACIFENFLWESLAKYENLLANQRCVPSYMYIFPNHS